MQKKVLIISYIFPPSPGIGGRRWAKFAKYLAQKGYEVNVICCDNVSEEKSSWIKDVKNPNIKVHTLPAKYPTVMVYGVKNIFDKLLYRFWKFYFSFRSKGVIFERTIFWRKQLLEKASELIEKEQIKNVVVTIPPYRLASYSVALKQKFPDIKLIIDYRDPWTDNKSYHGFKDLNPKRLEYEQQLENEVLKVADKIITVSDKMTESLKTRNIGVEKIITIPNGFDPDDIMAPSVANTNPSDNKIRFIYAGTLYSNLDYIVDPLLAYLKKLKETNSSLYNSISFEFYGSHNEELVDKIKRFNDNAISVHKPLPLAEIQSILRAGSFGVLMSAADHSFAFNTKFCEYIANRKPILLFSYPGETSDFLLNNKLGFLVNPTSFEKDMDTFFHQLQNIITNYNSGFNIDAFSIPSLTTEIEKLLK